MAGVAVFTRWAATVLSRVHSQSVALALIEFYLQSGCRINQSRRNLQLFLAGTGLGAAGASAWAINQNQRTVRRAGLAFDTTVALTVIGLGETDANRALDAGFAEIRRLEKVASSTRPGSDIRRLNAEGRLANPDPALLDMLQTADEVHLATQGAFDVTVQPLWILYDAYAKRGEWPSDKQSAPARALIGQADVASIATRSLSRAPEWRSR